MSQYAHPANLQTVAFTEVDPIIRLKEFLRLTGLGRSTVYKMISEGSIERPLRISVRAIGWRASSINSFLNSRPLTGVSSGSQK